MTYDCRICVCVFFYSFFKTFFHRKRNQKAVRSRFDESVRSASVLKKNEEFPRVVRRSNDAINFLSTEEFTKKKKAAALLYPKKDIIAKKCFPSLPLLSSFLRPARTRYEILFPSFSLCFPFFAFFAFTRFALRRFVVGGVSLSLSQQGNPRWQKYGSSSRDLSRVPFTSPFSRASLRDGDSGGFLLFSFILFSRRNEAACDDILPPSATFTGKKTIGLGFQEKNTHTLLSLSLSLSLSLFSSSSIARRTQNRTPRRRLSRRTTTTRSRRTRRCWRRPSPPSLLPAPRWRTTSKTCTPPPTPRAETVLASDRRKDKRLTLICQESKLRRSRSS